MIKLIITKTIRENYKHIFIVKSTLTEEYEIKEVPMVRFKEVTLVAQEIEDEKFNLDNVLKAINNL